MFRNRLSQAKPSDDLYKNFKANFPGLGQAGADSNTPAQDGAPASDAPEMPATSRVMERATELKDTDPTPRGSNEAWSFSGPGLTPSVMDPNSHTFNMFANQMPGYYTPTPGGTNTLYHHQAGDLHTPSFGFGLGTPLSLPTSENALHAGQQAAAFHGFHPQLHQHVHPASFHNVNPFHVQHQSGFPPHHFTHQPSFDPMEGGVDESSIDDFRMEHAMHHQPSHHGDEALFQSQGMKAMPPPPVHPTGDKFRFHVTLNAPTAMVKHSDEIPITYLNKGQAYTINVVDTHNQHAVGPRKYRTFVRVSFEDEQQRAKPAACWQLWKEGRGTNEAHQRGGRLQAVEYVESGQLGNAEDPSKPHIELESASFDGFCVLWSPPSGASECPISVRFNFLSTDFSHSKGVKGIPVRLCSKTELLEGSLGNMAPASPAEVCYCKVKLFRDHGAERKLSNDVAHVKKSIEKLNSQIAQIESGMRDLGKRKRASIVKASLEERPGKVPKHRRTWSMSSATSTGGRGSAEEDMHMKLLTLQDMFTSTRPASILYLRGEEGDDPDLHPVKITGEPLSLARTDTAESLAWERQSAQTGPPSSLVSPSPSNQSLEGSGGAARRDSTLQQHTPAAGTSRNNSTEWQNQQQTATMEIDPAQPQQLASPPETQPVKVQTRSPTSGAMTGWVEAIGVDPSYQPPPERSIKPVACFYVQPRVSGRQPADNLHRAIYLMNRTVKDFVNALAAKCDIEPMKVLRTMRISRSGLHILFDDECIRELPEGQDMTAEFCEIQTDSPAKLRREWDAGPTDLQVDGELPTTEDASTSGYELRLLF